MKRKIKGFFLILLSIVFFFVMEVNSFASDECTIELSDSSVQPATFTLTPEERKYLSHTYIYTNMNAKFVLSVDNYSPSNTISAEATLCEPNKQAHVFANTLMKPISYTPPSWATHTIYIIHNGGTGITSNETWQLNVHIDEGYPATLQMKIVSSDDDTNEMFGASNFTVCPSANVAPKIDSIELTTDQPFVYPSPVVYTITASDDNAPPEIDIDWSPNPPQGAVITDCNSVGNSTTCSFSFTPVEEDSDKTFKVKFKATDSGGLFAESGVVEIKVESRPSFINIDTQLAIVGGEELEFDVTAEDKNLPPDLSFEWVNDDQFDPPIDNGEWKLDTCNDSIDPDTSKNVQTCKFYFTPSSDDKDKTFKVMFTAKDSANHEINASMEVEIKVEKPPEFVTKNFSKTREVAVGWVLEFFVEAEDENGPPYLSYQWVETDGFNKPINNVGNLDTDKCKNTLEPGAGKNIRTCPFTFTPEPNEQNSTFRVKFFAIDASENPEDPEPDLTKTIYVDIIVKPQPPTIHIDPPRVFSAKVGYSDTVDIEIQNSGSGSFDITGITLPEYSADDNGYFQATFKNAEDKYEYDFYNPNNEYVGIKNGSPAILKVKYIPYKTDDTVKTLTITNTTDSDSIPITLTGRGETPTARKPFDFITVLDISGSMNELSYCPDPDPQSKLEGLKSGAKLLFDIMKVIKKDEDRYAVITFNNNTNYSIQLGTTRITEVKGYLDILGASGSTSMSSALEKAIGVLNNSQGEGRNKAILLVTDGIHNTPSLDFENNFTGTDNMGDIRLYVVGMGNEGSLNADLLKNIATKSFGLDGKYEFADGGDFCHTCSNRKLGKYLVQFLVDNLNSDEQIVTAFNEGSTNEIGNIDIPITASTQKAIFYLTWQKPAPELSFKLIAPDGTTIEPGDEDITKDDGYYICHLDFPYTYNDKIVNHAGNWKMTDLPDNIPYEGGLITKDPVIHADFKVEDPIFPTLYRYSRMQTGQNILLTARLTEGGILVPNGKVEVSVDVPTNGLGDFLYENDIDDTISIIPNSESKESPQAKKLRFLSVQKPEGLTSSKAFVTLDSWGGGIGLYRDAIYSGQLDESNTKYNGIYTFTFTATGTPLSGKEFKRTKTISTYLPSLPDISKSRVSYKFKDNKNAEIIIIPKDRFDHYLAPISTRRYDFTLRSNDLKLEVKEEKDLLNGELVFILKTENDSKFENTRCPAFISAKIGGTNLPWIDIAPDLCWQGPYLEVDIGILYPEYLKLDRQYVFGGKIGYNLNKSWSIQGEFGYSPGRDSFDIKGNMFQYNLNISYTLPLKTRKLSPFLSIGAGMLNFNRYSDEDSAFAFNIGAGVRWYTNRQKKFGFSFMIKDFIALGAYDKDTGHNLRFTTGMRYNF